MMAPEPEGLRNSKNEDIVIYSIEALNLSSRVKAIFINANQFY